MKSWKLTLGNAFSSAGSTMVGAGVIPQVAGAGSKITTIISVIGLVLNVLGQFFSHLYVADQNEMIRLSQTTQTPVPQPPANV